MFPCPNVWVPIWERLCRTVVLYYPMQIHRKRKSESDRLRALENTLWHLSTPYGIINSGHQNWPQVWPLPTYRTVERTSLELFQHALRHGEKSLWS